MAASSSGSSRTRARPALAGSEWSDAVRLRLSADAAVLWSVWEWLQL